MSDNVFELYCPFPQLLPDLTPRPYPSNFMFSGFENASCSVCAPHLLMICPGVAGMPRVCHTTAEDWISLPYMLAMIGICSLWIMLCVYLPSSMLRFFFSALNFYRSRSCYHSGRELYVQMPCCIWKRNFFEAMSGSYNLSAHSFVKILETLCESCDIVVTFRTQHSKPLTLCMLTSCWSLCLFPHTEVRNFSYEGWDMHWSMGIA